MNVSVVRERGMGGRVGYVARCHDLDGRLLWTARAVAWSNGRMLISATGASVHAVQTGQRAANALMSLVVAGRLGDSLDSVSSVVSAAVRGEVS